MPKPNIVVIMETKTDLYNPRTFWVIMHTCKN